MYAAIIMMVTALVSAATQIYATETANAQRRTLAEIERNKAITAKQEADYAREVAREDAKEHRRKVRQFLGKQRAAQSASGLQVDSGSFGDVTLDTLEQGYMDELAILYQGDLAAWRYEVAAAGYNTQADVYENSQGSLLLAGISGGISGAAQGYSMTGGFGSSATVKTDTSYRGFFSGSGGSGAGTGVSGGAVLK